MPETDEAESPEMPIGARRTRVLVADDDPVSRRRLELLLVRRGYEVTTAADGEEAWRLILDWSPEVALLDWQMPVWSGPDLCREVVARGTPCHVILVTARKRSEDIVAGLEAGAADYLRKPVGEAELLARIRVGERLQALRRALADRVAELEAASAEVRRLEDLLPICSYCKKVRDDHDYWQQLEVFITERTGARFSHGICPECHDRARADLLGPRSRERERSKE